MKLDILKKLVAAHGVSGHESSVRAVINDIIAPYADEITTDPLGNLIALSRGKSKQPKKIMLAAHMDEVGFIVTFIEDNGFLRCDKVGGVDFTAAAFCEVISERGVCGALYPEKNAKPENIKGDNILIDIGAKDKKDAARRVSVGDTFALASGVTKLSKNRVCGRPLDDRAGCYILLDIAASLGAHDDDIYFVFTAQEEVGGRGGFTSSYAVAPDISLVFDVAEADDYPGGKSSLILGGGAAIKIKDRSFICDGALVGGLSEIADKNKIKHQNEVASDYGTDGARMQNARGGSIAGGISVPLRCLHTATEIIDTNDIDACVALALKYLEK